MINKKIKNTQAITFENFKFKSKLELSCYSLFLKENLKLTYEEHKILLFEKIKLKNVLFYCPSKNNKLIVYPRTILNITYTPDFYLEHKGYKIFIDTKGQPNETYPMKKKMFLKILEERSILNDEKYIFFEPHNQKQIKQAIEIIKNLN